MRPAPALAAPGRPVAQSPVCFSRCGAGKKGYGGRLRRLKRPSGGAPALSGACRMPARPAAAGRLLRRAPLPSLGRVYDRRAQRPHIGMERIPFDGQYAVLPTGGVLTYAQKTRQTTTRTRRFLQRLRLRGKRRSCLRAMPVNECPIGMALTGRRAGGSFLLPEGAAARAFRHKKLPDSTKTASFVLYCLCAGRGPAGCPVILALPV